MLILILINVSELCPCTVPQESIKLPVTLLSIKINSVAETFKDDKHGNLFYCLLFVMEI